MKIWRRITSALDSSYLSWEYVRDVTSDTADQWLAVYRRDKPADSFVVALKRPRGLKGRKIMTGPGATY